MPGGEFGHDGEFGWSGLATTWFSLAHAPSKNGAGARVPVGVLFMSQCTSSFEFPHRAQLRYLAGEAVKRHLDEEE